MMTAVSLLTTKITPPTPDNLLLPAIQKMTEANDAHGRLRDDLVGWNTHDRGRRILNDGGTLIATSPENPRASHSSPIR